MITEIHHLNETIYMTEAVNSGFNYKNILIVDIQNQEITFNHRCLYESFIKKIHKNNEYAQKMLCWVAEFIRANSTKFSNFYLCYRYDTAFPLTHIILI